MTVASTFRWLLTGVLVLSVAGCAIQVSARAPSIAIATRTASPTPTPACPATVPTTLPAVAGQAMVPGTPAVADVCGYAGLNDSHPGALVRATTVSGARLAALVTALNTAAPVASGVTNCPNDTGRADLVVFGYASGGPVDVRVSVTGCPVATNGHRTSAADPELLARLATMTG